MSAVTNAAAETAAGTAASTESTLSTPLRAALAAATDDRIVLDLSGIAARHADLLRELPGVQVRFSMKSCPVDEVLACLAARGAGADAASPQEIRQALRAGVPAGAAHYGNTVKSDRSIAEAYALGVRDFATDSLEDVTALAQHAPGSRVHCRLDTAADGALWNLGRKFGCLPTEAVRILTAAGRLGLRPAGLSVHVGSQQMTAGAWRTAVDAIGQTLSGLHARGVYPDHVNFGGGLPALGYLDRSGRPLDPPLDAIFAALRKGMERLRRLSPVPLTFLIEPGRHLVADHGAIRAHVYRLAARRHGAGGPTHWLYLSTGRFSSLFEMDALQYRLEFPTHAGAARVPAVLAGPTCDSDDAYPPGHAPVLVPAGLASGDPVWIHTCGAYTTSYATKGFNGFSPLPYSVVGDA